VTPTGAKAFILNYYTTAGRERRYTIGQYPGISVAAARKKAAELKISIREGRDPLAEIEAERAAPTMEDLCTRFMAEHLPKKRPATQAEYRSTIELAILPALQHRKVVDIQYEDVAALHRKVTEHGTRRRNGRGAPYRANRVLAVLSKMFALAILWRLRSDNPAKGLEKNQELKRRRYLKADELAALLVVLNGGAEALRLPGKRRADRRVQRAVDIVRVALLTGARSGEVMSATWGQFDLRAGRWSKPAATTKTKQDHEVPLSAPARKLLSEIRARCDRPPGDDEAVFPGRGTDAPQGTIKKLWRVITDQATVALFSGRLDEPEGKLVADLQRSLGRDPTMQEVAGAAAAAGIALPVGLRDLRVHDLRHSYASFLASTGHGLPVIGALLGHTQPATTARYAHLFEDPLRKATERVGEIVDAADAPSGGDVIPFRGTV